MAPTPRLALAVLCLATGCSRAAPPTESQQPTIQDTPSSAATSLQSTPREDSLQSQPTPPTLAPVTPRLERRCPVRQEVEIEALGLDDSFLALLGRVPDGSDQDVFLASSLIPSPREIPIPATQNGWSLSGSHPSPSGRQLITRYSLGTQGPSSLWFTSLAGVSQREIITVQVGEIPRFISDEELIVLGDPDDDLRLRAWEYVPLYTFNTSTGEKTDLPPLPHIEFLSFYFTQQGGPYAVYDAFSRSPHAYYLFDYSSSVSSPIFQWLDHIEGWYPLNPSPHRRHDGSFMVTVGRSYGFDIAADLTLDQALGETSYEAVMRPVILPGGDSTALISLVHEDTPTEILPVFREDTDTGGQSFYMFNFDNMLLLDYCLESLLEGALYVSPDGRYLAGTLTRLIEDEFPHYQPYAALILDIESGHYAAIEGFVSLGWVDRQ